MQNAAFARARPRLGVRRRCRRLPSAWRRRVHGLVALGFRGANVTAPHKLAVAALCEAEAASVNTLVVRRRAVRGSSTDAAILAGLEAERPVVDRRTAGRPGHSSRRCPRARPFSRRGDWPPDASGADLVVHATPVRDEVLVELTPRTDARRPAVPGDGHGGCGARCGRARRRRAGGARRSGRRVVRAVDGPAARPSTRCAPP